MADDMGALLNEVGNILARDTLYPLDGTFIYVEADWGWVDLSIFKDLGDHVICRQPMLELADALLELWEAADPDKRWFAMQYRIDDGKFEATFTHEPLDPKISTIDRSQPILQRRYGNKQIVYPSLQYTIHSGALVYAASVPTQARHAGSAPDIPVCAGWPASCHPVSASG